MAKLIATVSYSILHTETNYKFAVFIKQVKTKPTDLRTT